VSTTRSKAETRLAELGYELGLPPPPLGRYVRAVSTGDLVYTAGHGPFDPADATVTRGQVGGELTLEEGKEAARLCVVACLASLKGETGDLDRVRRIVKMLAFVNCAPGFSATSQVVDGASELLEHVFGDRGVHARAAIGTSVLPGDIPVEIELVVEVDRSGAT
jgi:enamine deaminase RidA (YjgF/YER057c/UK114 family)